MAKVSGYARRVQKPHPVTRLIDHGQRARFAHRTQADAARPQYSRPRNERLGAWDHPDTRSIAASLRTGPPGGSSSHISRVAVCVHAVTPQTLGVGNLGCAANWRCPVRDGSPRRSSAKSASRGPLQAGSPISLDRLYHAAISLHRHVHRPAVRTQGLPARPTR